MASKVLLVIDQGSDYSTIITLTDEQKQSNFLISARFRKHYESSVVYDFSTSTTNDNDVLLFLSANYTRNITPGQYVFDVEFENTDTGDIVRILEGMITLTPSVQ